MENKKPRRLFEEMIERRKKIADAEKIILEEELKFNETVKGAKELVKTNNQEIMKIYDTQINVGAESLLEEIAKEYGLKVEDLSVRIEFLDTAKFGKIDKNKFLKLIENESFNGCIRCVFNVEYESEGVNHNLRLVLPLNLLHCQKDGRRLNQFLEVETVWQGWRLYTDLKCPDYRNLIFEFLYGNLVDMKGEEFRPKSKKCELILNAYERECEKNATKHMPSHDRHKFIQS